MASWGRVRGRVVIVVAARSTRERDVRKNCEGGAGSTDNVLPAQDRFRGARGFARGGGDPHDLEEHGGGNLPHAGCRPPWRGSAEAPRKIGPPKYRQNSPIKLRKERLTEDYPRSTLI